jgi:hypothetical protein
VASFIRCKLVVTATGRDLGLRRKLPSKCCAYVFSFQSCAMMTLHFAVRSFWEPFALDDVNSKRHAKVARAAEEHHE